MSAIPNINIPTNPSNSKTRPSTVRIPKGTQSPQSARAQTQRSSYQKALIQARLYAGCTFGKDAKKITIGSSRYNCRPLMTNPGPGAYNPPRQPLTHRFDTAISNYYPETDYRTLTSEIDYGSKRVYPEVRPMNIGEWTTFDPWTLSSTPAPNFVNKRQFAETPSHRIQNRQPPPRIEAIPGPGTYDPSNPTEISRSTHLVMGNERRGHWLIRERNPSPADYSPNAKNIQVKEPCFSFGGKSRPNKRRDRNLSPKRATIGIDVFLVKIDPSIDEAEARDYVRAHPDLKNVLHDVMELILEKKPIAPVGFMRDYFIEQKREMGIEDPEPEVDPLDYYKALAAEQ